KEENKLLFFEPRWTQRFSQKTQRYLRELCVSSLCGLCGKIKLLNKVQNVEECDATAAKLKSRSQLHNYASTTSVLLK
ncbi:MAG: hypothetical protein KGL19_16445, partial [Bacteroidota bacterium]|nr:hypothetical protein [Bacteroidota bacterium]